MTRRHARATPRLLALGLPQELSSALVSAGEKLFGAGCVDCVQTIDQARPLVLRGVDAVFCSAELADAALAFAAGEHPALAVVAVLADEAADGALHQADTCPLAGHVRAGAVDAVRHADIVRRPAAVLEKCLLQCRAHTSARNAVADLRVTASQLKARNDRLEQELARLESLAWTDPLTGLANRRQMQDRLPQLFAQAVRYERDMACLMIDLDGFKNINDLGGHARGDALLGITSRVIQSGLRGSDFAARYGGDEFVVLMPLTSARTAASVAKRLCDSFKLNAAALLESCSDPNTPGAAGHCCGMSIGIASIASCHALDGEGLVACADAALYAAKAAGRGSIRLCTPEGRFCDASSLPADSSGADVLSE